jgi:hypothetical protein
MELQHITTSPLAFFGGNVAMPLRVAGLASQFTFRSETYHLKEEFHCSLVCVKCIQAGSSDREPSKLGQQVLEEVEVVRKQHEPTFLGYRDELRHVTKNGRQSIVIMVNIANLEPIFEHLRKKLDVELPSQPTHVTLHSTVPNYGIGIPSQEALETITDKITGAELDELKAAMRFDRVFGDKL